MLLYLSAFFSYRWFLDFFEVMIIPVLDKSADHGSSASHLGPRRGGWNFSSMAFFMFSSCFTLLVWFSPSLANRYISFRWFDPFESPFGIPWNNRDTWQVRQCGKPKEESSPIAEMCGTNPGGNLPQNLWTYPTAWHTAYPTTPRTYAMCKSPWHTGPHGQVFGLVCYFPKGFSTFYISSWILWPHPKCQGTHGTPTNCFLSTQVLRCNSHCRKHI